jgi:gamma-glutamyltranspeptidase/glutathione hydrolase
MITFVIKAIKMTAMFLAVIAAGPWSCNKDLSVEYFQNGCVVSGSSIASRIGVEVLKNGGNAFDAAVATGFALAVTYPEAGNIGGGGFMVALSVDDGRAFTLDFRETAPGLAFSSMFQDKEGNVIPEMSVRTHNSVGVPGTVDGLLRILADHGSGIYSRQELLAPAIGLAENGFPVSRYIARKINSKRVYLSHDTGTKEVFFPAGITEWSAGDILVQKDLAETLRLIAKNGRDGFYKGKTADLLIEEIQGGGGLISRGDLESFSSVYREPVRGTFRGYDVISMGPPSSGGILLIQMLNMVEFLSVDRLQWNSRSYVHLLTEIERRAYADRAEHLGDPDFWEVPAVSLMSKDYAMNRTAAIDLLRATPSDSVFAGTAFPDTGHTTHYSIIDKDGNCISVTTTLNKSFGSGLLVDGAGFLLNNEMDDFSAKPGVPNEYGLIGNEANSIQGGKRPLSSMTPTIILKNDDPFMIIGSPGGSRIITTVLQALMNVISHDMNMQTAVAAPRVHAQWLPDVLYKEPGAVTEITESELAEMGHSVQFHDDGMLGQANGILIDSRGISGGADPRGDNAMAGY